MKSAMLFICLLSCLVCTCTGCAYNKISGEGDAFETASPSPPTIGISPEALRPEDAITPSFFDFIEPLDIALCSELDRLLFLDRAHVHDVLGDVYTYFDTYEMYPQQGIAFRFNEVSQDNENIHTKGFEGKISVILLDPSYPSEIVNGITMSASADDIIASLGAAPFSDPDINVIGYKLKDCYLFFAGDQTIDEVAIYPRGDFSLDSFFMDIESQIDTLSPDEETASELVWYFYQNIPDYTYCYQYGTRYSDRFSTIGACYLDKGILLCWEWDNDIPILTVYGNNPISSEVMKRASDSLVVLPKKDSVFEYEKERWKNKEVLKTRILTEGIVSPDGTKTILPNDAEKLANNFSGLYLISNDNTFRNREVKVPYAPISWSGGLTWLDNRYVVFNAYKTGIALFDTSNDTFQTIYNRDAGITVSDRYFISFSTDEDNGDEVEKRILFSYDENGDISYGLEPGRSQ